jgi:hypothetical protein
MKKQKAARYFYLAAFVVANGGLASTESSL